MTDAREIIARHLCTMAAQGWSEISPFERAAYRTTAAGMVEAVTTAGFRVLGPDEVDAVTVEEVEAQAEQIMLDVANEWHRQIGIDEVLKSKLVKRIADTVATGVFSRAIRALINQPSTEGGKDGE